MIPKIVGDPLIYCLAPLSGRTKFPLTNNIEKLLVNVQKLCAPLLLPTYFSSRMSESAKHIHSEALLLLLGE